MRAACSLSLTAFKSYKTPRSWISIPRAYIRRLRYSQHTPAMTVSSRRSPSTSPPPAKRQKFDPLDHSSPSELVSFATFSSPPVEHHAPLNYRNSVVLAPMVRSGTLPSRLLALKYGADLVWGPEIVDRAMIGCSRVVDEQTGLISYDKAGKPIWTTHPIERPYLVYQIGSASPELAVKSALLVANDVSGIELNCGCPKPFSTHGGMGAELLTNPELLCSILSALRAALPNRVSVSAKIRLLPDQDETLTLVRQIVKTGISCLTIHCRTKTMRKREKAMTHRLREIVEYVDSMGLGVPVIENGDCVSRDDAARVMSETGAHSVMIATAAETNLSCFASGRLEDAETVLVPSYIGLAKYLGNPWGNTKHCLSQFSSPTAPGVIGTKASLKLFKQRLASAKSYDDLADINISGNRVMHDIEHALSQRLFVTPSVQAIRQLPINENTDGTPTSLTFPEVILNLGVNSMEHVVPQAATASANVVEPPII